MARLFLEEVLKKKKISKRKFITLLGMDRGSVRRYFQPDYNPTLSTLERIAKVLDVRIRDLIKE